MEKKKYLFWRDGDLFASLAPICRYVLSKEELAGYAKFRSGHLEASSTEDGSHPLQALQFSDIVVFATHPGQLVTEITRLLHVEPVHILDGRKIVNRWKRMMPMMFPWHQEASVEESRKLFEKKKTAEDFITRMTSNQQMNRLKQAWMCMRGGGADVFIG